MERYSRQEVLERIGPAGQEALRKSRVCVIGCGALGSVSADRLARAGVGHLVVVDRDLVELSNLQRQLLFEESDVGRPKALVTAEKLRAVNSDIIIEELVEDVNHSNVEEIISGCTVVVDALDNTETRYLINDACVKLGIPWIYGGAIGTYGMVFSIMPGETGCMRCFMPQVPRAGSLPTCDTAGVLNTIPAIISSMQCTEVFKVIVGAPVKTGLQFFDVWAGEYQVIDIVKRDDCVCCGKGDYEFLDASLEEIVTTFCGKAAIQITPIRKGEIDLGELAGKLKKVGDVELTKALVKFRTSDCEMSIFKSGRAIVYGTEDEKIARSLYARYVGT